MKQLSARMQRVTARPFLFAIALIVVIAALVAAQPALLALAQGNAGSIGGTIFHDRNGNGVRDAGEPPLPGVYVTVSAGGGTWTHDFYSGDDGTYAPAGLGSGDYDVHLQVPKCYRPTRPVAYTGIWIDGAPGTVVRGLDFGLAEDPRCKQDPQKPRRPERPQGPGPYGPPPQHAPPPPPQQHQPPPRHQPTQPQPQGATYYTVKAGDTLYGIATSHGLTLAALAHANDITNVNFIYVGQVLRIPNPNSPAASYVPPPPPEPSTYYTVKAGDTLYSIATSHGTTVAAIAALNKLSNVNFIYVGQQLAIP